LSPQGKATTSVTYEFLGKSAEAAVYSYVGISLYTSIPGFWSFSFITAQLIIIVVGRIIAVIVTFYAFTLCFKKRTIKFKELLFIVYGGMIRGAIAFALVLNIPEDANNVDSVNRNQLYRSTCLVVVMSTTLIFGTFMKMTQGCLLGEPEHDKGGFHEI
jgi:sodium/hydrogen exchanger-like protein 6/7/sodium/hydrogen exchanger 8